MNKTDQDNPSKQTLEPIKHGQGIRANVDARKHELELALANVRKSNLSGTHIDAIETALNAFDYLLTGDPDNIPEAVAANLSQWLESSKFLIEHKMKRETPAQRS